MEPVRFGVIAEGQTDYKVIRNILMGFLAERGWM